MKDPGSVRALRFQFNKKRSHVELHWKKSAGLQGEWWGHTNVAGSDGYVFALCVRSCVSLLNKQIKIWRVGSY